MKSQLLPLVNPGRLCAHGHILTTILSNQELQQNVSVPCLPWKVENWANPPSLYQADTDTLVSSDRKRPKSETGPSGHIMFSHSKDAPYSCQWPSMGEDTWLIPKRLGASKVPFLTAFFPCLQTTVPGADWPTQLPPSPGGFCGDFHQEPQPDALWQCADRESPAGAGWFLLLGAMATGGWWAGKSSCIQVGSQVENEMCPLVCCWMMKCVSWKPL